MTEQTHFDINLIVNNVPKGYYSQNIVDNSRHVVLNLDPVIINPKKKTEKLPNPENLSVLDKCQQLFIFKSAEPWCQLYVVKTRSNQRIFIGKSDETNVCAYPTPEHHVSVLNSKEKELMRIRGEYVDSSKDARELSFLVTRQSSLVNNGQDEILGQVKLFDLNGFHFVTGISNILENVQFSTRGKNESIQIIQDGQSVAVIDFRRESVINWIDSYMLTFTKELSCNSKAIIIAACISYDIGFCQNSDSIKTILIYILSLLGLFFAGFLLYNYM